jgi:hypothetical protein
METRSPAGVTAPPANDGSTRRKRRNGVDPVLRYFLPKPGSSPDSVELGQEVASEGEALIQSFKSSQPFYTLAAWKAVPEVNGGGNPVIVKQAVTRN